MSIKVSHIERACWIYYSGGASCLPLHTGRTNTFCVFVFIPEESMYCNSYMAFYSYFTNISMSKSSKTTSVSSLLPVKQKLTEGVNVCLLSKSAPFFFKSPNPLSVILFFVYINAFLCSWLTQGRRPLRCWYLPAADRPH